MNGVDSMSRGNLRWLLGRVILLLVDLLEGEGRLGRKWRRK